MAQVFAYDGIRPVIDPSAFVHPAAVVIGPEDTGLPAAWLDAADTRVRIPMRAATADALNASVAAAVLLFEAVRQRG